MVKQTASPGGNSWPTAEILVALDNVAGFSKSENKEITFRWCMLGLKANYRPVWSLAVDMVATQGRMKFTFPLYKAMYENEYTRALAVETFAQHRDTYHPICSKKVKTSGCKKERKEAFKLPTYISYRTSYHGPMFIRKSFNRCLIVSSYPSLDFSSLHSH